MQVFHPPKNVLNVSVTVQDKTRQGGVTYQSMSSSDMPWPEQTEVACWRCCHQFSTPPVGIPCATNSNRLVGMFCSFNCAYAWALDQSGHHTDYTAACRLKQYAQEVHGVDPETIVPSPDPLVLEMFGGPMSIKKYRDNSLRVQVITEPFVSSHMLLCAQHPTGSSQGDEEPVDAAPAETVCPVSEDRQFQVTGLRRPADPLPLEKVLCEQNVGTRDGLFQEYLSRHADASAATPAPPVVVSRGGTKPGRRVNSLARFVRNGPKKNNDTTKTP